MIFICTSTQLVRPRVKNSALYPLYYADWIFFVIKGSIQAKLNKSCKSRSSW